MQFHALCVTQICRICCGRLLTTKEKKQKRTAVPCSKYASDIFLVFGINIKQDSPGLHSESICLKCISRIKNYHSRRSDTALQTARELAEKKVSIWISFDETISSHDCGVCSSFYAAHLCYKSSLQTTDQLPATTMTDSISFEEHTNEVWQPSENAKNVDDQMTISSPRLPLFTSTPLKEINNLNLSSSTTVSSACKQDKLFSESLSASPTRFFFIRTIL